MKVADLLAPEGVLFDLRAPDKRRLLEDLARRSARTAHLDSNIIFTALTTREALGSTGIGGGVALPHARLASLANPVGLFARVRPPVEFEAVDGKRVDLIFLLLLPNGSQGDHLNALACVARRLRDASTVLALRSARDGSGLYSILTAGEHELPQPPAAGNRFSTGRP